MWRISVRRVSNGSVGLSLTISHTMTLDEYDRVLELLESHQALKVAFLANEMA
jgi:threonine dehydrogenase-like Zn-dependent dehydrogenase